MTVRYYTALENSNSQFFNENGTILACTTESSGNHDVENSNARRHGVINTSPRSLQYDVVWILIGSANHSKCSWLGVLDVVLCVVMFFVFPTL